MMHRRRRWALSAAETPEALATMLTDRTWTLCSGFFVTAHPAYVFLNDATHEDGAGEYAIVKKLPDGRFVQVESITFSWCDAAQALAHIRAALAGEYDASEFANSIEPQLDAPGKHGRCGLCA